MAENFANEYQTQLNGAIDSSVTSLVVDTASGSPSANFRIRIDDELMLVTNKSGTTFTVTRGVEGSTAAAHSDNAVVTHVLTAAAIENIRAVEPFALLPYYGGGGTTKSSSTANRCVYIPFLVPFPVTVVDARIVVGTQNGNMSIAIYNYALDTRIVTTGSIAVPASGRQVVSLTDTPLDPGRYYVGFSVSSGTATFSTATAASTETQAATVKYQESAHPAPTSPSIAGDSNFTPIVVLMISGGYP